MRSEEKQKGGFYIKKSTLSPYFVLYLTMLRLTL